MADDDDRYKLLYKVSTAYYEDKLTYEQIGRRFGFSRMTVSRLLEEARAEKVVQIVINPPKTLNADLERRLEARYGLDEAVVVTPAGYEDQQAVIGALGPAAAQYLLRYLRGNEIVSLSWGHTLLGVVDALPVAHKPGIRVVPIIGGLGRLEDETYGAGLVHRMARAFGGKPYAMPAPGIVRSRPAYEALMAAPQVTEVLSLAARSDVALVGIGAPLPGSAIRRAGILSEDEIQQLQALGAVGDIALRYFDAGGRPVAHALDAHIIGLRLDQIQDIPRVIAAAGGSAKYETIRATLRGGYFHVLVTDDRTAARLLEETTCPRGIAP
jgi:DNA-binding transcriptional regulator LsrR (DeoR family)